MGGLLALPLRASQHPCCLALRYLVCGGRSGDLAHGLPWVILQKGPSIRCSYFLGKGTRTACSSPTDAWTQLTCGVRVPQVCFGKRGPWGYVAGTPRCPLPPLSLPLWVWAVYPQPWPLFPFLFSRNQRPPSHEPTWLGPLGFGPWSKSLPQSPAPAPLKSLSPL